MEKSSNYQELRKKFRKGYKSSEMNTTSYTSNLYMQAAKPSVTKKEKKQTEGYTPDWMIQAK